MVGRGGKAGDSVSWMGRRNNGSVEFELWGEGEEGAEARSEPGTELAANVVRNMLSSWNQPSFLVDAMIGQANVFDQGYKVLREKNGI